MMVYLPIGGHTRKHICKYIIASKTHLDAKCADPRSKKNWERRRRSVKEELEKKKEESQTISPTPPSHFPSSLSGEVSENDCNEREKTSVLTSAARRAPSTESRHRCGKQERYQLNRE